MKRPALVIFAMIAVFLSETRLEAYLDPGSGSMLVQLLLGGFAGAAVLLKLSWRRLRDRIGAARLEDQATRHDE